MLYSSKNLIIDQIGNHTYVHTSYLETEDYGRVKCNGLFIVDAGEVLILDTPTTNVAAEELVDWITQRIKGRIIGVVPTHFHEDCLGSLEVFHQAGILSIANNLTIRIAKEKGLTIPQKGFAIWDRVNVGRSYVELSYPGPGHTTDNIVAYYSRDACLFGGCLIKAMGSGKGNLSDANIREWPESVIKVKRDYQDTKIVVPGHGHIGGAELLDYTIELFQE